MDINAESFNTSDVSECICKPGYVWNTTQNLCTKNCSNIWSVSINPTNVSSCICRQYCNNPFRLGDCSPYCLIIPNAVPTMRIVIIPYFVTTLMELLQWLGFFMTRACAIITIIGIVQQTLYVCLVYHFRIPFPTLHRKQITTIVHAKTIIIGIWITKFVLSTVQLTPMLWQTTQPIPTNALASIIMFGIQL